MRVTPKSGCDRVESVLETARGPALAVRVRAAPDKGEANRATEATVAAWLGMAKSNVAVVAGGTSRLKSLEIAGETGRLAALIQTRLAELRK